MVFHRHFCICRTKRESFYQSCWAYGWLKLPFAMVERNLMVILLVASAAVMMVSMMMMIFQEFDSSAIRNAHWSVVGSPSLVIRWHSLRIIQSFWCIFFGRDLNNNKNNNSKFQYQSYAILTLTFKINYVINVVWSVWVFSHCFEIQFPKVFESLSLATD